MSATAGRLLALLALLGSPSGLTGVELAKKLGVSTRTIRKDIDRLRELEYLSMPSGAPSAATAWVPAASCHP